MEKYVNVKEKLFVEISYDEFSESPREWSNLWTILTWEHGYNSIDKNDFKSFTEFLENYFTERQIDKLDNIHGNGWDHFKALEKAFHKIGYLIAPINRYRHGSVCYSVGTGSGWDHGIVGIAIVSHDKLKYEYISKTVTKQIKEKAFKRLDLELNDYTSWANGEVYSVSVKYFNGDIVDSISGMLGYENEYKTIEAAFVFLGYDFDDFELMELEEKTTTVYSIA